MLIVMITLLILVFMLMVPGRNVDLLPAVAAVSIETGRILDVEVMTRYCQGCININSKKMQIFTNI